jgi:hypothetical protein
MIDGRLRGIRTNPRHPKTTIIAYADDVSILITAPEETPLIKDALMAYQEASGATVNIAKSQSMAIGGWDEGIDIMGIEYKNQIKILGISFHPHTHMSITENWTQITRNIRLQESEKYNRNLSMSQRRVYIHMYLLSRAWYAAQILPLPKLQERQISTTMSWFLWHGGIFKVPLAIMQLPKRQGGWDLINIAAKSLTLYLHRSRN